MLKHRSASHPATLRDDFVNVLRILQRNTAQPKETFWTFLKGEEGQVVMGTVMVQWLSQSWDADQKPPLVSILLQMEWELSSVGRQAGRPGLPVHGGEDRGSEGLAPAS